MEDRSESRLSSFAAYITELSAKSETFQSLILGNTDRDARFNKRNHPIADLSHILTVLDVPGPYDLNFDEGLISSGAQFIVQNSLIGSDEEPGTLYRVAAKTPKFMLDCQERLNLSADSVRRQHPSIVDMIGWGYTTSWHAAPFLALELAQGDLGGLVKEAGESIDAETQMADMDSASQAGMTIQHATCDQEPQHQPVHIRSSQYSRRNWEIPELRGELARDFLSMYLNNESHVSPAQAFGVFMNRQYFILKRFRDTSTRDIYIRLLRTAALGGIMQARSLIFRYYEYFELVPDDHVEAHREEWTLASIATGDLAFSERTRSVNQRGFDDAMAKFHANGGYNRHYVHSKPALRSCINLDTRALQPGISTTEPLNEDGDYLSHVLASFRLPETLEILKTIVTPTTVNLVNAFGESLLYRACSCGATETVAFLLDLGADPTLRLGGDGPSCLHWLFVFHPEDIDQVADGLIGKGASVDVKTNHNHKMLYYPYRFPAGSPLHWAVEQYIFSGMPPPVQPNSIDDCLIEPPILGPKDGSSALDLAVQNWDAGIVCLLLEYASSDTRASSSGIGVLHHLLAGDFRWISKISQIYCPRYWPLVFEIDSLCLAWDYLWGPETTCTALMLAVYMANMQVAEALLRAGADVNIAGSGGQTAIMELGECYSEVELETEDYEFCKALQRQVMLLLLAHGARIDGRSNNGRSPILALAVGHHIGAVEVLLENGAMINDVPVKCGTRQNDRQFPVLYDLAHPTWAIARDIDLADMMRTYALPDLKQAVQIKPDPAGMTILHSFVVRGFIESTGVLLETGINVNAVYEEVINGKVIPITPLDLLYQRWPNLIHDATRRLPKSGSYASHSFQVSVHEEGN
ncbi:hypothetical protein CEP52_010406 [Fusarium oligoseptatum]|uniref:Uncharacterized protein n=1 Tax=Fusarium oligoseptatum TaxID=2604345 RepID=A0A428T892_9HYPO|nr:hypothetical protein CEP52_010406 [Fusarium oligoseptatum]